MASADRRLRDEVWEADPDVWIASAHTPAGVLLPVDGGYRLSGEWRSVAAIDHCEWVVVGARAVGAGDTDGLGLFACAASRICASSRNPGMRSG